MKRIELVLCVLLLALGVSSCSNMDELYKDYLTGSIYSGKVSDLTATAGNERVLLQWTNPKDQISKRIKVVYGEPEEIVETESLVDELYIENLSMGSYEVYGLYDGTSTAICRFPYRSPRVSSRRP